MQQAGQMELSFLLHCTQTDFSRLSLIMSFGACVYYLNALEVMLAFEVTFWGSASTNLLLSPTVSIHVYFNSLIFRRKILRRSKQHLCD